MSECKLEQMASFISTKVLSKYSEIEQANMPSIICEEVSTESIKAALDLPELKEVFNALEFYKSYSDCAEGCRSRSDSWVTRCTCGFVAKEKEHRQALSKLKSLGIVKEGEK